MAKFIWQPEANRIVATPVGYGEASVFIGLPSRRWRKEKGEYVVPITRMNAEILITSSIASQIPDDLAGHLYNVVQSKLLNRPFPHGWYKHKKFNFLPDQLAAVNKLYPLHCGAFLMPMGTGKSKALIDMCTAHFMEQRIRAVVLLAPLTTTGVWIGVNGQLEQHSPIPFKAVHADSSFDWTRHRPKGEEILWITCGLESLSAGGTFKKLMPFIENNKCAIAVDESHWIKNHDKIRTVAAKDLRKPAELAYIMTGTPATRNMIDLYSQYDFLDPNIVGVGDYYAFRNRYCVMGGYKRKEITGYCNVDELMGLLEPYSYICDVPKGLPEQVWGTPRPIRMTDDQFDMYQKVKQAKIETISVKNVLNKVLRLSQICGGFLYEDPKVSVDPISGKIKKTPGKKIWSLPPDKNPKLVDLLEQIEQEPDRQFVIWAKYLPEIEIIHEAVSKLGTTAKFTGQTEDRPQVVEDFQQGKIKYLVANPQIGAMSWTLTAATRGYYYSNTERLDDRLQSEKRIHRQGQTQNVLYGDWEMRTPKGGSTTDTTTLASIAAKKDLDQYIKDEMKKSGNKLDNIL